VNKTSNCPYCNVELDDSAQFDHVYPVSEGGLSTIKNMIWCCSACNAAKSNKGLITFLQERGFSVADVSARLKALGKHV
jgi:5-methylcytosine-specific restriction endonuclease McrA